MSCERIQAQLRDHASLDAAAEVHLDDCVECAAVAAESEGLCLAAGDVALPAFDGMFGEVEAALAAERGPRAWLRSRGTALRLVMGIIVALGVPLAVGVATLRADIGVYPVVRFALLGSALVLTLAAAMWVALRPLHRPPLSRSLSSLLGIAAMAAVAIAATLPAAHLLHPSSLLGAGDDFARLAWGCFVFGAIVGVPVALVGRVLGRGGPSWLGSPIMAPLAGGIAGNLALHLHCPIVARQHLIAGHASVVVPFLLVFAVVAISWRRAR